MAGLKKGGNSVSYTIRLTSHKVCSILISGNSWQILRGFPRKFDSFCRRNYNDEVIICWNPRFT